MKSIDTRRAQERADWTRNAEFYRGDDQSPLMHALALRRDVFYEIEPHERVLDLGCGSGATVARLRARGIDAVGVDYAAEMVEVAATEYGLGDHVFCAEAAKLPFASGTFDMVLANGVFHHLAVQDELSAALQEIRRVLRPGGRICCFDRNGSVVSGVLTKACITIKEFLRWITRREPFASCASRNEIAFGGRRDLESIGRRGYVVTRRRDCSTLPFFLAVVTLNTIQYFVSTRLRRRLECFVRRPMEWIDTHFNWHWLCVEQFAVFEPHPVLQTAEGPADVTFSRTSVRSHAPVVTA